MSDLTAKGPVKRLQIEAVVIRADGEQIDLGTVSDSGWKKLDPRRWIARKRTERANQRMVV